MAKSLLDIVVAATGLVLTSPILVFAAVGIRLTSPGPVIYRAQRVGRYGSPFTMFKFRTMHVGKGEQWSTITAQNDSRVFWFGRLLRSTKVDELPQLFNVLRREMSIVGPRPEDPAIVAQHYTPEFRCTLDVLPGLASPGSIYNYTHGETLPGQAQTETAYVEELLPVKMALELEYLQRASMLYDLQIIWRTATVITLKMCGRTEFPAPPEMQRSQPRLAA